jgi:hypothetical protein
MDSKELTDDKLRANHTTKKAVQKQFKKSEVSDEMGKTKSQGSKKKQVNNGEKNKNKDKKK